MRAAGMICECNPLHEGHLYCIEQAKRLLGEETAVICVMSGNFVQRGDFAVLNKFARAESLVRSGADLVLELPVHWATASAELFARGGVQMLCDTGVVTDLVFGSESGDIHALEEIAAALLTEDFQTLVQKELASGVSYPTARQRALSHRLGASAELLSQPNNILGVEYCKALRREKSTIRPVTVQRLSSVHDGAGSASQLRQALRNRENILPRLPDAAGAVLRREMQNGCAPVFMENCERAVLARLRRMTEEEFAPFDEGGEGLYHRMYEASRTACSVEELLGLMKTKRYPLSRLRRMVLRCYLGLSAMPERPPYLRVLAANKTGRMTLAAMRGSTKILTKSADVSALGDEAKNVFCAESRATDLYVLAYPELQKATGGSDWRTGPVIV
jgi:predicted nucleotidyltransferase